MQIQFSRTAKVQTEWVFPMLLIKRQKTLSVGEQSKTVIFLQLMVRMQPEKILLYLNGSNLMRELRLDLVIIMSQNNNSKCGLSFYGTGAGNFWEWVMKFELIHIIDTERIPIFLLYDWYLSNWIIFKNLLKVKFKMFYFFNHKLKENRKQGKIYRLINRRKVDFILFYSFFLNFLTRTNYIFLVRWKELYSSFSSL